jgi:hypothetical protein
MKKDAESQRTPRVTPPSRQRAGAIALGALAAGGNVE